MAQAHAGQFEGVIESELTSDSHRASFSINSSCKCMWQPDGSGSPMAVAAQWQWQPSGLQCCLLQTRFLFVKCASFSNHSESNRHACSNLFVCQSTSMLFLTSGQPHGGQEAAQRAAEGATAVCVKQRGRSWQGGKGRRSSQQTCLQGQQHRPGFRSSHTGRGVASSDDVVLLCDDFQMYESCCIGLLLPLLAQDKGTKADDRDFEKTD